MSYARTNETKLKYQYPSDDGNSYLVVQREVVQAALPTYAQLGTDISGITASMKSKFAGHIHIEAVEGETGTIDRVHRKQVVVSAIYSTGTPNTEIIGSVIPATGALDGLTWQCTGYTGERKRGGFTAGPQ